MRFLIWLMLAAGLAMTLSQAAPPKPPVALQLGHLDAVEAHPGDTVTVSVPLTIARGYHVNANPAATDDYIPLELSFQDSGAVHALRPVYPKGTRWRLEGTTEDLLVYGGAITIPVPLVIDEHIRPGDYELSGTVDYQACDDQVCFMPESRTIKLPVRVTVPQSGSLR